MAMFFNDVFPLILEQEGGWKFTDNKNDAGGKTFGGMTFKTFEGWLAKQDPPQRMTPDTFQAVALAGAGQAYKILQDQIVTAYHDLFWAPLKLDHVDYTYWPQLAIFSCAINCGVDRTAKALQQIVGTKTDGVIGEITLGAMYQFAMKRGADKPRDAFRNWWRKYYIDLVQSNTEEWVAYALALSGTPSEKNFPPDKPKYVHARNLEGWLNRVEACFQNS